MKQLFTTMVLVACVAGGQAVAQQKPSALSAMRQAQLEAKAHSHPAPLVSRGSAPANDECAGAIVIAPGETCTPTAGSADGATQSMDPITCGIYTAANSYDVWYSFVATSTATHVSVTGDGPDSTGFDAILEVFSGDCGSLTSVGCSDATVRGEEEAVDMQTTIGNTYHYRVYYWPYDAPQTIFGFNTCVTAAPPAPANDECAGAITLTSNALCLDVPGSTDNAFQSMPGILCNGYTGNADDDVWYSFVATNTDQTISVQGYGGFDAVIELFSGTCDNLTSIACGDNTYPQPLGTEDTGDSLSYSGLAVGTTYYFRVYDYNTATATPTFAVCVQEGLESSLGVAEHVLSNSIGVFPNPSNGDFSIAYNAKTGNVGIQVIDMTGRVLLNTQRALTQGQTVSLSLAGKLAEGQYLLRLDTPEGRKEQRITVK